MSKKPPPSKQKVLFELDRIDWERVEGSLNALGYSHIPQLIQPQTCFEVRKMYSNDSLFRKRIIMEQHNFGIGDYAYFAEPLPKFILSLRAQLYERLAPIANGMMRALRA